MTSPVGSSGYYTPAQVQMAVDVLNGKEAKKEEPAVLTAQDNFTPQTDKKDFIIAPKIEILKSGNNISADKVSEDLKGKGIEVGEKLELVSGVTAKLDSSAVKELEKSGYMVVDDSPKQMLPDFPDVPQSTPTDKAGKPWDMKVVEDVKWTHASDLHKQGLTGKGQVIAILDTGYNHPQKPLLAWYDAAESKNSPVDPHGHGTHVSGDAIKMAPDADLVGVRVLGSDGLGRSSNIIKGIQWVVDNKDKLSIDVANMSLGMAPDGEPYTQSLIDVAVEGAIAKGITFVNAAGNSGPNSRTIGSPGDCPSAITVGAALDPSTVSKFSGRGPTDDKLEKPDIVAPGEYIVSWASPGSKMDEDAKNIEALRALSPEKWRKLLEDHPNYIKALDLPNDILKYDNGKLEHTAKMKLAPFYKPSEDTLACPGTSMATPEVAGIVADLSQASPGEKPEKYKEALGKTADNMGTQYGKNDQGAGFVRADKAKDYLKKKEA